MRLLPRPLLRTAFPFLLSGLLSGCGLQKEIDIPAPAFEPQLAVECYLMPGQPYRLLVQRTTAFGAAPQPDIPRDAVAVIIGPRSVDTLRFFPSVDSTVRPTQFFTHTGFRRFDGQPGETYALLVYDGAGHRLTATTTVLAPVPIDTVEIRFNPNNTDTVRAGLLTRYRDPAPLGDAYRYSVLRRYTERGRVRLEEKQDFAFDDAVINGQPSALGSSYRFDRGDTLTVRLYHIELAYRRFLKSIGDARAANGNPFAQPAAIQSTVQNGIGAFTALSWAERTFVVRHP